MVPPALNAKEHLQGRGAIAGSSSRRESKSKERNSASQVCSNPEKSKRKKRRDTKKKKRGERSRSFEANWRGGGLLNRLEQGNTEKRKMGTPSGIRMEKGL